MSDVRGSGTRPHALALIGAALTTISGALFLLFFFPDLVGLQSNPYLGIVTFLLLQATCFLMKVTWGTYSDRIRHTDSPGCFRCHDGEHKAPDGSVIRQDSELCHAQ
jgi:hypothetical protein